MSAPTTSTRTRLSGWVVPAGLLGLLILSFGILLPKLGFYWDDWPVILTGRLYGTAGFLRFYQYDRPISAWTYILTFPLLGSQPSHWQVFTLLLRWATAVAMWWTLIRLWPNHQRQAAWAAFLFAIYPVFTQQSISVAYSQHWICYLLFFLSLAAMVQAYRSPRWFWPLTTLALAVGLLQLLTMEYFAGLEFLRPMLLWVLVSEQPRPFRKQAVAVLRRWLLYLLLLVAFVIWRLFFLKFPGQEANPPILLYQALRSPIDTLLRFVQISVQDTVHLLVSVWAGTLSPQAIDPLDRFVTLSWLVGFAAGALVIFFFRKLYQPAQEMTSPDSSWARQALVLGAAGVLFGVLPVWLTDRQIIVGMYSNRFGLPAMFGASLVIVGLLEMLIRKEIQRVVLVGVLVCLAVSMHLRTANDYRWSWAAQTRFYQQLAWRAPGLQPGTAIFADGELFPYVGIYSTAAGINLVYPPGSRPDQMPYWFISLGRSYIYDMPAFNQGAQIKEVLRNYAFEGSTKEGLVISYEPDQHDCLEVLTPQDRLTTGLPPITLQAVANSNLSRILAEKNPPASPPTDIFGVEPEHSWCYLYEKAALAQQQGDWERVVMFGEQANALGFGPKASGSNTPLEWIPFIEGYARQGQWRKAQELSAAAFERDRRIDARLCGLWEQLETSTTASQDRDAALQGVRSTAQCPQK